jgi:hypothetical protein
MYRARSLRAVAEEISKYKLHLVGVEEIRWDGDGTEPADKYTVTCRVVHAKTMRGSSSDDWSYWHFGYTCSLNYTYIEAIQRYH